MRLLHPLKKRTNPMDENAGSFGWNTWPFRIVADEEFARVWADRAELRGELDRRLRRLKTVSHSTVQLIWADFGAGKSHTLRRLEAVCLDDPRGDLLPMYTEIPVGTEKLLDLYRRFVGRMSSDLIERCSDRVRAGIKRSASSPGARDVRQALKLVGSEDAAGRNIALEWMQAPTGLPHLRSLKAYGIGARIEDDIRVVEVMTELIQIIRELPGKASVVWLIDECQRIADVPQRKRDAFAKSIVSLFNSCPSGLHFVLSFSGAQQSTALALIPPDLRSRAGTFPMLSLPNLTREDCLTFSRDLFETFRIEPHTDGRFPFTESALEQIVDELEESSAGAVTPRLLMERLESVLFELLDTSNGDPALPIEPATAAEMMARIRSRQ